MEGSCETSKGVGIDATRESIFLQGDDALLDISVLF